jgi:hypothetical protein
LRTAATLVLLAEPILVPKVVLAQQWAVLTPVPVGVEVGVGVEVEVVPIPVLPLKPPLKV